MYAILRVACIYFTLYAQCTFVRWDHRCVRTPLRTCTRYFAVFVVVENGCNTFESQLSTFGNIFSTCFTLTYSVDVICGILEYSKNEIRFCTHSQTAHTTQTAISNSLLGTFKTFNSFE